MNDCYVCFQKSQALANKVISEAV